MSTEADIVERAKIKAAMITMGEKIAFGSDPGMILELVAEVERLRAERDAAVRDMRERCIELIKGHMLCGRGCEILMPRADGNMIGLAYVRAVEALPLIATTRATQSEGQS